MPAIRKSPTVIKTREVEVPKSAVTVARVPEKRFAAKYIHRTFHGVNDFDLLDMARNNAMNVLLEGPTGPGKTSLFLAYAAEREMNFYAVPSNVAIEPSQLFGKPWNDSGIWKWVDGGVTDILRNGGLLDIAEINFLPDRIATVLFGALDVRREITLLDHKGETIRAHRPPDPRTGEPCWCNLSEDECKKKWVLIGADMNPEYEGTRPLNKALRNRFSIIIDMGYDPVVEAGLVRSDELRALANDIRTRANNGEFETPVSTNKLVEFEQNVRLFGLEFAIQNFTTYFQVHERLAITNVFRAKRENLENQVRLMHGIQEVKDDAVSTVMVSDPFDWLDGMSSLGVGDADG